MKSQKYDNFVKILLIGTHTYTYTLQVCVYKNILFKTFIPVTRVLIYVEWKTFITE